MSQKFYNLDFSVREDLLNSSNVLRAFTRIIKINLLITYRKKNSLDS